MTRPVAEPMTKERIEALRALCEKATPGPWFATSSENEPDYEFPGLSDPGLSKHTVSPHKHIAGWRHDGGYGGYGITNKNADLIAAARTALPEALDEIERLRAALEQQGACKHSNGYGEVFRKRDDGTEEYLCKRCGSWTTERKL